MLSQRCLAGKGIFAKSSVSDCWTRMGIDESTEIVEERGRDNPTARIQDCQNWAL